MGVTNYFSVDGEVIAESGAAGYLSYHRDNLGSVCATLDSGGALVHQYQYKRLLVSFGVRRVLVLRSVVCSGVVLGVILR